MKRYLAAIIVPCYNEAERLPTQVFSVYAAAHPDIFFCFVDDGSTDSTQAVLTHLCAAGSNLRWIALPRNQGKAAAVRAGMKACAEEAEFIGFWDADLSTPLVEIERFLEVFKTRPEKKMVIGARWAHIGVNIHRRAFRHGVGRAIATLIDFYLKLSIYDTQCGAKIFRSETARVLFAESFVSRWLFDVELFRRLISLEGLAGVDRTVVELPLDVWIDVPGSKLSCFSVFRIIYEMIRISLHYKVS